MSNHIELRHLKYFNAVAKELNFRKAAETLFISQPGLSRQISQLEDELGVKLFYRDKRKVSLTQNGEYLKKEFDFIINHLEHVFNSVKLIDLGDEGEIRLGFVGSAVQILIPELLSRLNSKHPGIHATLSELSNKQQIEYITNERLDIGFIRSMRIPDGLTKLDILEETFSVVLPHDYPINKSNFQSINQLKSESFILFTTEYSHGYYDKIMSIFEDQGFTPNISHRSVHANTIFKLVENNLGIAIVPTSLKKGANNALKFIELKYIPQRTVLSAVWLKNNHNPVLKRVIDQLHSLKKNRKEPLS